MIKRIRSRTMFEIRKDLETLPGLSAAILHSCPMSVADLLHEWYATFGHDLLELPHVSEPPTPLGGDDGEEREGGLNSSATK